MLIPWYEASMLAVESNGVIALRLAKMSRGGWDAAAEARQMVSEKISASFEIAELMFAGASSRVMINRYRDHVAANSTGLNADTVRSP